MSELLAQIREAGLDVEAEDCEQLARSVSALKAEYKDAAPTSAMLTYAVW